MPARASRRATRLLATPAAVLALAVLLAGCGDISWEPPATPFAGAGEMQVEDRTEGSFTRVSISAPVRVVISESAEPRVTVEAQAGVLPLLATEIVDGQLVVSPKAPGFTTSDADYPTVTISAPGITSVAISGGSIGTLESTAAELRLDITGQSSLSAIGEVPSLTISMAQAAHADLTELKVQDATVKMADGSAATMTISGAVKGEVGGGATLTLTQQPASQAVEVAGGGSVLLP